MPRQQFAIDHDVFMADGVRESELVTLEPLLHRLPVAADRATIGALLDPDFFEVGASGSVYQRSLVLDVVERRYRAGTDPDDAVWNVQDFSTSKLSDNLYLVTYQLSFADRLSRRCTLWRWHELGWKAVYHQGTPCELEPDA